MQIGCGTLPVQFFDPMEFGDKLQSEHSLKEKIYKPTLAVLPWAKNTRWRGSCMFTW